MRKAHQLAVLATGFGLLLSSWSYAQRPEGGPPGGGRPEGGRGEGGPGGPGGGPREGRGGPGGPGGNMMQFLPVLAALDADKNGEISAEEIDNAAAALKKLDKNGDGKLTEEELRPNFPGGRGGPGGGRPGEGGRGGEGRGPGGEGGRPGGPPPEGRGGEGRGPGGPPPEGRGGEGRPAGEGGERPRRPD